MNYSFFMSYDFYKILHLSLLLLVSLSLGGLALFYSLFSSSVDSSSYYSLGLGLKKILLTIHGLCMLVIFISGFGLIAKLDIATPWSSWIYVKMMLWLTIALSPWLLRKNLFFLQAVRSPSLKFLVYLIFLTTLLFLAVLTARLKY